MNEKLLDIVVCPLTHQPLRKAGKPLIANLNREITEGALRNQRGEKLTSALREALVTADGRRVYPVYDGLAALLEAESIVLEEAS